MAPELLQKIRSDFKQILSNDPEIKNAVSRINEGKATYKEVEDLSYRVGKDLSKALTGNIKEDILPNGHVPQNVAEKILHPVLKESHNMVIEAAVKAQEAMNKAAGIGLKAQTAEYDEEKAQGLALKLTNGLFEETKWVLDEPVTSFVQNSADRTLQKNVEFQARAGLKPMITREAEAKCCPWCADLEGTYDYGNEPKEIYRRHERCRCTVDFRPGNGKKQDVWSKSWHEDLSNNKKDERINSDTVQEYRPVIRSKESQKDLKYKSVEIRKIEGYDNQIFISESANIKPKAVHIMNQDLTEAIQAYGGNPENRPRLVILSEEEIGNRVSLYEPTTNTIYAIPEVGDKIKILELQTDMASGENSKATMFHETWHWMQAEEYRKAKGEITQENRSDYFEFCIKKAEKRLENAGITIYNVNEISEYASVKFEIGRFDETDAELQMMRALKR